MLAPVSSEMHAPSAPRAVQSGADLHPATAASPVDAATPLNRLLLALPMAEQLVLAPMLKPVRLVAGELLQEPGRAAQHVVFPDGAVATIALADGGEVDAIGRDGMIGLAALLGEPEAQELVTVRVAGAARRIESSAFRRAFAELPLLRAALGRHAYATTVRLARTVTCSRTHLLAPRLAALLLWLRDQTGSTRLPLTHEQLAHLLGVSRRASVTDALLALRQPGGLEVRRGGVTLRDAEGLLAQACPCYLDTRVQLDRLTTTRGDVA